jgi:hypothetical protein
MSSGNTLPVRSPLSYCDEAGPVYFTDKLVLRAVPVQAAAGMRAMIASGLTDALAEMNLTPSTRVGSQTLPDSVMVVEHPRLPFVTYPYEWSYGMLREAAACVLQVNKVANQFGYELIDCHGFNVVFDGPRPKYVDLGSLGPLPFPHAKGWAALETFVRSYQYPLEIWSDGGGFIARRLLAASELMRHDDYGLYRWPWLRYGAGARFRWWTHMWYRYRESSRMTKERIQARLPLGLRGVGTKMLQSGHLPGQAINLDRMLNRLLKRRRSGAEGSWSKYQNEDASFIDTPRFKRVAEIVKSAGLDSVIELGGNQGYFSDLLLSSGAARRVICADYDEPAIDRAYERSLKNGSSLQTVVLDFVHPMVSPFGESPATRLQCDGVVVLAVTHHILLTQKVPLARLLQSIAAYGRRFIAVEFMPLGLWDGQKAPPIPTWYNLEWFRTAFAREFEITHDESLEVNRHLFCGWKREPVGAH